MSAAASVPTSVSAFPPVGMSRWQTLRHVIPVSRETWRKLGLAGLAPAPIRISERCTMYSNAQILLWLADPVGYRQAEGGAA